MWKTRVQSLGREGPLEKKTATHSSTLALKIPWRSLVGYSPWGRKESDMTERLHFHFYVQYISIWASVVALVVKNPPASAGDVRDVGLMPGLGRSPEEGMVTHSSIFAWKIP